MYVFNTMFCDARLAQGPQSFRHEGRASGQGDEVGDVARPLLHVGVRHDVRERPGLPRQLRPPAAATSKYTHARQMSRLGLGWTLAKGLDGTPLPLKVGERKRETDNPTRRQQALDSLAPEEPAPGWRPPTAGSTTARTQQEGHGTVRLAQRK